MRLINADALKEEFAKHEDRKGYLIGDWEEFIDNAPTIDDLSEYSDKLWKQAYERGKAEARPQGEWIDEDGSYYANCSCCGYQINTHHERGYLKFCPNCGADMRGGRE